MTDADILALRLRCHTTLPGHQNLSPAQTFARMAAWCEQHQVQHDTYGEGELVQAFEQKVAALLGMEAGLFCMTGTMTQVTALRLACEERGSDLVALHASSHILVHEKSNYQLLQHFNALQIGNPHRPWLLKDLQAVPEKLAAAQYELPMREIGGQLPPWEELEAIKAWCREADVHLHMDGARLWEAAAGYGRSLADVARGFETAYVSFYKGIGGLGGAMLLGNVEFIAKAKVWMHRQGGSIFRRSPYVVSAAMQFDDRLAALPACFARTQWLFETLRDYPVFKTNPAVPQCNMLHLYLPVDRDTAITIRNRIAQEHGIWLFNNAVHTALPGQCMFEWYAGDNLLTIDDAAVRNALTLLADALTAAA
ncbi:threonine aldolase [Undibacterium sp. CY18W]|uniref:Threonine aldolase n=1 Tax=Undibacterium hunanense TaxID=2762292 RepID=A0ABR6ZTU9_9BURK|nr:beta-eliminating lyase-related protein [Undibacterium hunanense]MBC3918983.1 threonine aldolase [Undibacterium hunanense]